MNNLTLKIIENHDFLVQTILPNPYLPGSNYETLWNVSWRVTGTTPSMASGRGLIRGRCLIRPAGPRRRHDKPYWLMMDGSFDHRYMHSIFRLIDAVVDWLTDWIDWIDFIDLTWFDWFDLIDVIDSISLIDLIEFDLIDWLVGLFVDRLTAWLIGWLVDLFVWLKIG